MNFEFLFFCRIFKIFSTIAYGNKNLTEEKMDFEEETGDRVLNDEVELGEDGEDDDGDEDDAEGDEEEDDEEGEEVMDFFFSP